MVPTARTGKRMGHLGEGAPSNRNVLWHMGQCLEEMGSGGSLQYQAVVQVINNSMQGMLI